VDPPLIRQSPERAIRWVRAGIRDCPINGVWVRPVFISEWFFRTDRRR
jgi:hypothetical protein